VKNPGFSIKYFIGILCRKGKVYAEIVPGIKAKN
jgi:hypothetical protein